MPRDGIAAANKETKKESDRIKAETAKEEKDKDDEAREKRQC